MHGGTKKLETTDAGVTVTGDLTVTGGGGFQTGMIMLWYGSANNIPSGWVLCNGGNNTPDLRSKFVIGASGVGSGGYQVGAQGGSADATLVSHTHNLLYNHGAFGGSSGAVTPRSGNTPVVPGISGRVSTEGSSATNANLPPYYALCYIMKL